MSNRINPDESEFVKDKRKNHCKGCMNQNGYCSACEVLNCWLRKTYLPEGVWAEAVESDITWENVQNLSNEIDKNIMRDLKIKGI